MSTASARILAGIAAKSDVPVVRAAPPSEPEWVNLDTDTLSPDLLAAYSAYREAAQVASTLRKTFEDAMSNAIDPLPSERVIFGYRFGKLSLAIVPAEKPKRSTSAISLAVFKGRK